MTASILASIAVLWVAVGLGVLAYRRATLAIGAVSMPVGRRTPLTVDEICDVVDRVLCYQSSAYLVEGGLEISVTPRLPSGYRLTLGSESSSHETLTGLLLTLRVQLQMLQTQPRRVGGAA